MGGGRTQTKLMLNSTLVEVEVEVGVELGNISFISFYLKCCIIVQMVSLQI